MQIDKMLEAMRVIAEFTFSERLKRFVETGSDRKFFFVISLGI